MKTICIRTYKNELHFPIMQGVPIKKETNLFKRFIKFLIFRRRWTVLCDYCLWVPALGKWIFVPMDFIFDGASVPKILNGIYSPTGMLLLGAVPHDFGYRYKGLLHVNYLGEIYFVSYTKSQLDSIFHILNTYESGMPHASYVAKFVLTLVGFLGWRENRKSNRILMTDHPEIFIEDNI
ncbi:MAG: DUF1353 domain-containing protein [Candidatus Tenebribacter davisii]|nr:DUF1353 domain-containing protein [Candidatus Tenebribacter davisii]